jgi:hypothetical protein
VSFKPTFDVEREDALPSDAALALCDYMRELNNEHWDAGWLIDCEFQFWSYVVRDRAFSFFGESQADKLKRLAEAAGGWIAWNDEKHQAAWSSDPRDCYAPEVYFVPMDEWARRYSDWLAKHPAWKNT